MDQEEENYLKNELKKQMDNEEQTQNRIANLEKMQKIIDEEVASETNSQKREEEKIVLM